MNLDPTMTDSHIAEEATELLDDMFTELPFDSIPCPKCMSGDVKWRPLKPQYIAIPLRDEHTPLYTHLPVFSYSCPHCKAHGKETFSSDLLIDNTRLSLLYVFHIIHAHMSEKDIHPGKRKELEYGLLSSEAFSIWYRRFHQDVSLLTDVAEGKMSQSEVLSGNVPMTDRFIHFFLEQQRFFMHAGDLRKETTMLIVNNPDTESFCIDILGRKCQLV